MTENATKTKPPATKLTKVVKKWHNPSEVAAERRHVLRSPRRDLPDKKRTFELPRPLTQDEKRAEIARLAVALDDDDLDRVLFAMRRSVLPKSAPRVYPGLRSGIEAPDFVVDVYGPWLTGAFTRADLKKLDRKAYTALDNWEQRFGETFPSELLPAKRDLTRAALERGVSRPSDEVKQDQALRRMQRRHSKLDPK